MVEGNRKSQYFAFTPAGPLTVTVVNWNYSMFQLTYLRDLHTDKKCENPKKIQVVKYYFDLGCRSDIAEGGIYYFSTDVYTVTKTLIGSIGCYGKNLMLEPTHCADTHDTRANFEF
jgi:hypothetical protein